MTGAVPGGGGGGGGGTTPPVGTVPGAPPSTGAGRGRRRGPADDLLGPRVARHVLVLRGGVEEGHDEARLRLVEPVGEHADVDAVDLQPAVLPEPHRAAGRRATGFARHDDGDTGAGPGGEGGEALAVAEVARQDRADHDQRHPRLGRQAGRPGLVGALGTQRPQGLGGPCDLRLGLVERLAQGGGRRHARKVDDVAAQPHEDHLCLLAPRRGRDRQGQRPQQALALLGRADDGHDAARLELDQQVGVVGGRADRQQRRHRQRRVRRNGRELSGADRRDPALVADGGEAGRGRGGAGQHQ